MSEEKRPLITITIGAREAKCLLAAALLVAVPFWLFSESISLSTTYPSPAGIYNYLITTGAGNKDTVLNKNGGNALLAPASNASGSVLVGLDAPAANAFLSAMGASAKLVVQGSVAATGALVAKGVVRVGTLASNPSGVEGALYFNTTSHKFQGYQNGQWSDLGAAAPPGGLYGTCAVGMTSGGGGIGGGGPKFYCMNVQAPATCVSSSPTSDSSPCRCPAGYSKVLTGTYISGFAACGSCSGSVVTGGGGAFSCMKQ